MDFTLSGNKLFIKTKGIQVGVSEAGININDNFLVSSPGEYEVGGVSVLGIVGAPVYVVEVETLRIFVCAKEFEKLTEVQLSEIGSIDVSWTPIQDLSKQVDPWVILTKATEGDERAVSKYSVTKDKLPADLLVVALTTK
jgi:hypothetical protein